jgi:hypothetical protein
LRGVSGQPLLIGAPGKIEPDSVMVAGPMKSIEAAMAGLGRFWLAAQLSPDAATSPSNNI